MPHKLLLADDSVTIQRVIELTFADEDIQVIAVGDGRQAIERMQSDRPDIVLADVGMPERDGYEVAAFVKGQPEFAHVPVLLLTGAFEPIDEGRARAAGCDGVLVKPFEPQMVINRVKDLLAGRRPAGLWAAAPAAQPTRQPAPASDFDLHEITPATPDRHSGGSLEDYFDRLDVVFADLDGEKKGSQQPAPAVTPPPAERRPDLMPLEPGDALADWDPDLKGDPSKPAPVRDIAVVEAARLQPPPDTAQRAPVEAPRPMAPPAPQVTLPQGPSLAEAFAALLAAEQGQAIAPPAVRPTDIPDATIDAIVQRVIDRMTDEAVRGTVVDVAERMVRDEIARIKRG